MIKKEDNIFKVDSIKSDIYIHFKRMGKELTSSEIDSIGVRIFNSLGTNSYFHEMDKIEAEYGVGPETYEIDFPEILRQARCAEYANRVSTNQPTEIEQYDMEGNYIQSFDSLSDASFALTGDREKAVGGISNCASGKNRHALGFIWSYGNTNKFA